MHRKILTALLLLLSASAFAELNEAQLAANRGDYTVSIKETTRLAAAGDPGSQLILGVIYHLGEIVPRNDKVATEWLQKAAATGNANAQYFLGNSYGQGLGIKQNYKLAADWYRKAAAKGVSAAQVQLGHFYLNGLGVIQNDNEAFLWYSKAALMNNPDAQQALGLMNYLGRGLPQNHALALEWLRKAAAQRNADAQALMASIYQHAEGNSRDLVLAYALFGLAINGNTTVKDAPQKHDEIASQLTSEQREASMRLLNQLARQDNFTRALNDYLTKPQ